MIRTASTVQSVHVYADGLLILADSCSTASSFKSAPGGRFDMNEIDGMSNFLGQELDVRDRAFSLKQRQYLIDMLHGYGLDKVKLARVPMDGKPAFDASNTIDKPIREAFGSLLNCAMISRPNIANAVCVLATEPARPSQDLWAVIKRIILNSSATSCFRIRFECPASLHVFEIDVYTDVTNASEVDSKPVLGFFVLVNKNLVAWSGRKQNIVTLLSY